MSLVNIPGLTFLKSIDPVGLVFEPLGIFKSQVVLNAHFFHNNPDGLFLTGATAGDALTLALVDGFRTL